MSQRQTTTVTCPQCGYSQDFPIWSSLNVSLDPDEKPRLLSGELHRFACGKTATATDVAYPILYHDMDLNLMIYNIEDADNPEEFSDDLLGNLLGVMRESYTFRHVHSRNELVEKIKIADAGLDDRMVEIFKILLRGENTDFSEGELFFDRLVNRADGDDTITFCWLADDDVQEITLPLATYRAYEVHYAKLIAADIPPGGTWQCVDSAYVSDFIARHSRITQS